MDKFYGMRKRLEMSRLMDYLVNGEEESDQCAERDIYQEQVDAAYDECFDKLNGIFQTECRKNEALCSVLVKFCAVCTETYFKAGMVAGFQIYKNLDTEFQNLKGDEAVIAGIRKMAAEMAEEK